MIKRLLLPMLLFLVLGLVGCTTPSGSAPAVPTAVPTKSITATPTAAPANVEHPAPESKQYERPADLVELFTLPGQSIKEGSLELYQNTSPDWQNMPFKFFVSPSKFKAFAQALASGGVTDAQPFRFVIHWPGDASGSEALCEEGTGILALELAREVFERVYQPHFASKDLSDPATVQQFLNEAESQMNYSLFHEARHIPHCRNTTERSVAENEARLAEKQWTDQFGHVIFIALKEGQNLQAAMDYVKGFRK